MLQDIRRHNDIERRLLSQKIFVQVSNMNFQTSTLSNLRSSRIRLNSHYSI